MEATNLIHTHRSTLLISDQTTYQAHLTRRILALRRRLGITTPKSQKFAPHAVSAADVSKDRGYAELLLLQAERSWARGMRIKAARGEGEGGLKGRSRSEVVGKCAKAAKIAGTLVQVLQSAAGVGERDVLEARAYQAMLEGSAVFERLASGRRRAEKAEWERCVRWWSEARVIYAALDAKQGSEACRELLAGTVDPTIRYVAYQAGVARTVGVPEVARRFFPKEDKELVKMVEGLDQDALREKAEAGKDTVGRRDVQAPNNIDWRGRKAGIVDASIGQALANVATAETKLKAYLAEHPSAPAREKAAAYDDILIASQDAADATKRATDELEKERVDEGDARMQDLRVTSLAVNYALVSWRVGRNRIMIGGNDGLELDTQQPKTPKRLRKDGKELPSKDEGTGKKLARLRERLVLYDATIQSIESVKDFRGAMRDEKFVNELEAKVKYFRAMKCANISHSHQMLGEHLKSLALLSRANELLHNAEAAASSTATDAPPTLDIDSTIFSHVRSHLSGLLSRTRALVVLHQLEHNSATASAKHLTSAAPWVQRLHDYPHPGTQVDLKNLVSYPPRLEPVPVKPLFLDVAWNYIDYPGRRAHGTKAKGESVNGSKGQVAQDSTAGEEKKRGWFGFGR